MNRIYTVLFFTLCVIFNPNQSTVSAKDYVSAWGQLSINGSQIVNQHGEAVQLQGMSLFWSQWSGQWWNYDVVKWLADDWCVNVVRAAMGVDAGDGGYITQRGEEQRVRAIVEAAIDLGIYVIIDWHSHHADWTTGDAEDFFRRMANDYGHYPNVLYEVWNEPLNVSWGATIKPHCEAVIGAIREKDPDGIVICGTQNWSQNVDDVIGNAINWTPNIAYTLHYYATSHGQWLRNKGDAARAAGLCVFVTEYGVTEASGNGSINVGEANAWWNWMHNNKIAHCNWSVHNKNESSAALQAWANTNGGWSEGDLTQSGQMVRNWLRSHCPEISDPTDCAGVVNGDADWDACGQCAGGNTGIEPCGRAPFEWERQTLPGRLEAEYFDWGGQEVTWNESDELHQGGSEFRQYEPVDIDELSGGGYAVSYIEEGEWLVYSVDVQQAGQMSVSLRAASDGVPGNVEVQIDGQTSTMLQLSNTSSWAVYEKFEAETLVELTAGEHEIKLIFGGGFNLDYVDFEWEGLIEPPTQEPFSGIPSMIPGIVEAEEYDLGGQNVSYFDVDPTNRGEAFREDAVDIESFQSHKHNVGYMESEEWLEYTVEVQAAGQYNLTVAVAAMNTGGVLRLISNDQILVEEIMVPATGDWHDFQGISIPDVELQAGVQIIRLEVMEGGFNLDYLDFSIITRDEFNVPAMGNLALYPNPTHASLQSQRPITGDVSIYNALGLLVFEQFFQDELFKLNVQDWPVGLYWLSTDQGVQRFQVVR